MMPEVDINIWAVLVAAVVSMVVGSYWYSKSLFGKEWAKLVGRKLEEMGGGGKGYAVATAGALLQAYILAHFVQYAGATTFWDGIVTGFWLWLGFVAVVVAMNLVFEGKSWVLWKINAGYFLVVLLINGGLLAAWR
ncbi:DUF1761 domain-containing protein [Candidatus Saccharibacteria bacterium]|nr:DUF1761 domain-containing protein [Candidatus Saccharibacteria bacterium]